MHVLMSQAFLSDFGNLQPGPRHKCEKLISDLREIAPADIATEASNGWRLHKLHSSPFKSFSLDMNKRVLAIVEGETINLHRVVPHSLADDPRVNRNDTADTDIGVVNARLQPSSLYSALLELAFAESLARPFRGLVDEDGLLDALGDVDPTTADIVLHLYETDGVILPSSRLFPVDTSPLFQKALSGDVSEWEVYLHPSQRIVVGLPVDYGIMVTGSAGTGKTVCAWHRTRALASKGYTVGFACRYKPALEVSRTHLERLIGDIPAKTYYVVATNVDDLLQLAGAVDHVVVDEGQEFAPTWHQSLWTTLRRSGKGMTLFYDLNQLGRNTPRSDKFLFQNKVEQWHSIIGSLESCQASEFSVNYRNSEEIYRFYYNLLVKGLPAPETSELPAFRSGPVRTHETTSDAQTVSVVLATAKALLRRYHPWEVGIVVATPHQDRLMRMIVDQATRFGVATSMDIQTDTAVLVASASTIRGHERKAIVAILQPLERVTERIGILIESYIALSRARESLTVVCSPG